MGQMIMGDAMTFSCAEEEVVTSRLLFMTAWERTLR